MGTWNYAKSGLEREKGGNDYTSRYRYTVSVAAPSVIISLFTTAQVTATVNLLPRYIFAIFPIF